MYSKFASDFRIQVTFSGPFRSFLTARYPYNYVTQACAKCQEEIEISYPEKVSYYGDLQRRVIAAGESYNIYLRIYNGTEQSDALLFPSGLELRAYLIQRPVALASRECTATDPHNDTSLCYDFRDFQLTSAVYTDENGFATFNFMAVANYRGLYRLVFTVGTSTSGANFLTQMFEIEVVSFMSADDCTTAAQAVPKEFQRCLLEQN